MSKLWKIPLALGAALAMLALSPGTANAAEDPVGTVLGCLTDPSDPACALPVPGNAVELPLVPAPDAAAPAPGAANPVVPIPPVTPPGGRVDDGADHEADDGTDDGATPPVAAGADDLTPACQDLIDQLGQHGLPADLDCGAIADCVVLLAPAGMSPEELGGLSEEQLTDLLDSVDGTGFLSCIQDVVGGLVPTPTPTPTPPAPPVAQPAVQETSYANCDDARARGAAPVYAGQPGYRAGLDSDADGIGCEDTEGTVLPVSAATVPTASSGQLAYTGFELTPVLAAGTALLALGGGLLLSARRRS
jgi:hypothetical protein